MKPRGFTLVELLLVIALLILAGLAVMDFVHLGQRTAADHAALDCARALQAAEDKQRGIDGRYVPYADLPARAVRPCGFLDAPPPGQVSRDAYQFAVRHAGGTRTYLVNQSEIRTTPDWPRDNLDMTRAAPLKKTKQAPDAPKPVP